MTLLDLVDNAPGDVHILSGTHGDQIGRTLVDKMLTMGESRSSIDEDFQLGGVIYPMYGLVM